jgi:predicted nucleic acid-binding protein
VGTLVNIMKRGPVLGRVNLDITLEVKDPGDAFLIAMAIEGGADYLVTGDHRAGLIELGHAGKARIVTPAVFRSEALG